MKLSVVLVARVCILIAYQVRESTQIPSVPYGMMGKIYTKASKKVAAAKAKASEEAVGSKRNRIE